MEAPLRHRVFVLWKEDSIVPLFPDGATFALPTNALPGVPSRPAQPGDVLTIYGVGFGPVTGGFTAGTIVTAANSLNTPVQFFFGNTQATVDSLLFRAVIHWSLSVQRCRSGRVGGK